LNQIVFIVTAQTSSSTLKFQSITLYVDNHYPAAT